MGRGATRALCRPALALALALLAASLAAPASADSRCAAAKFQAAGRYLQSLAKCQAKATAKGAEVDPLCIAKAQSKLATAFDKAEGKDDCLTVGDVAPVQDVLDDPAGEAFEILLPPLERRCCANPGGCFWAESVADCDNAGVPGEPGSVCNGDTRECVPPPGVGSGTCCEDFTPGGLAEPTCVGRPQLTCAVLGVTEVPDSICHGSKRCLK
jgi:hypothetical protein